MGHIVKLVSEQKKNHESAKKDEEGDLSSKEKFESFMKERIFKQEAACQTDEPAEKPSEPKIITRVVEVPVNRQAPVVVQQSSIKKAQQ